MAENTAISWTDHTWSPVWGCTEVSKAETGGGGCDNCYARVLANRFGTGWNGAPMREFGEHHWNEPLRWNRRAAASGTYPRVFPSMCDPFDKNWPDGIRERFWRLIEATPHLRWLLLTKRIGNARSMLPEAWLEAEWPRNVRVGSTVVNQPEADRDITKLLALNCPNFLSIEPMLGPVDLGAWLWSCCGNMQDGASYMGSTESICCGRPDPSDQLDWVICGGESGPHARPMHPDWARSLRDQCAAAGVAFHFKQHGEWAPHDGRPGADLGGQMRRGTAQLLHAPGNPEGFFRKGDAFVERVGKKSGGRALDGIEHNGFPT